MPLEIPKDETESIARIKSLAVPSLSRLVAALQSAPPIPDPQEMAALVSKQVPSIPLARLASMLVTIYNLYHVRELAGVDDSRFVSDVLEGIEESPDLKFTRKDIATFRSAFTRLMDVETLRVVAKAIRLQRDGERLYCSAKILSDIRPVFGSDPTTKPLGAVLTHTMKVGYHEGREHKEFHVVLETADLIALEDVVSRAIAKDRTLRQFLGDIKMPKLDE